MLVPIATPPTLSLCAGGVPVVCISDQVLFSEKDRQHRWHIWHFKKIILYNLIMLISNKTMCYLCLFLVGVSLNLVFVWSIVICTVQYFMWSLYTILCIIHVTCICYTCFCVHVIPVHLFYSQGSVNFKKGSEGF